MTWRCIYLPSPTERSSVPPVIVNSRIEIILVPGLHSLLASWNKNTGYISNTSFFYTSEKAPQALKGSRDDSSGPMLVVRIGPRSVIFVKSPLKATGVSFLVL